MNAGYDKVAAEVTGEVRGIYPKMPLVGVGAVLICDGKILLEKRKHGPGKGKWSNPGGLVELGEGIEQTVIREVKEETNLEFEGPKHIDVRKIEVESRHLSSPLRLTICKGKAHSLSI